ncbi:MAG: glycine cleavage system protein GcvH [Longimicrobiales bacterium]|jgi:glycine cleavage system H protein|nr:glycine cleavage system protein GcvH [Longimicrobiales bacterium]|tara:strand:- start:4422 stop:4814 length:393 start_codon:yes stop_codon:yes gene_type:complete
MMSEYPEGLRYTEEHEYLQPTEEDGVYRVGITDYAQAELGDVVYVELPEKGSHFDGMGVFGTIEAVKAVSDLYCPLSGKVVEVNDKLDQEPALINTDPYGDGWMVCLRLDEGEVVDSMMDATAYQVFIGD